MAAIPSARVRMINNIFQVNARSAPGLRADIVHKVPTGQSDLVVVAVQPDPAGDHMDGKRYQWLHLRFATGSEPFGWIRDDLLEISGDFSAFGYGQLDTWRHAFGLMRQTPSAEVSVGTQTETVKQSTPQQVETTVGDDLLRVRLAAFNITAAWEGGSYAAYQNHDSGIVSFGRFQFTLASGSLFSVVDQYLQRADTPTAAQLRQHYHERLRQRDITLRHDATLRHLLIEAADDPTMQAVQDAVADERYWQRAFNLSIEPRGVRTALGQAFIFDMAIQHGLFHDLLNVAERAFGIPLRTRLAAHGVPETDFFTRVAAVRQERLHRLADARNLPGLRPRADFWVELMARGDWDLQGEDDGLLTIKIGRRVPVREP